VVELTIRELSVRFSGSYGGLAWGLLSPLFQCAIYGVVFGMILRIPAPAGVPGGYAMFLLAGWLPWMGFADSLQQGSAAITQNGHLIKKMQFPAETLVVSRILAALILQGFGLVALTFILGFSQDVWPRLPYAVLAFSLQFLVLLGPVLALSAISVFFRDVFQILPTALTALLYLTPVLYPESQVPRRLAPVLLWSPMRDTLGLFRAAFLHSEPPPASRLLLQALLFLGVAAAGIWLFRKSRPSFADVI
jgi:ABC-type polysaccharide/polyol phosphate export permease